jgi:hypothetical protein
LGSHDGSGQAGDTSAGDDQMILVDPASWRWRGQLWAHLVSDQSYEELHRFAAQLGVPPKSFQGDHYDLPSDYRDRAIALGATAVSSRELVGRLRAAGLRQRRGRGQAATGAHGHDKP